MSDAESTMTLVDDRPYLPFEKRLDLVQGLIRAYVSMVDERYLLGIIMGDGMFLIKADDSDRPLQAISEVRFSTKIEGQIIRDAMCGVAEGAKPEIREALETAIDTMKTIVLFDRDLDRSILLWDRDIGDVVDELYKGTELAS